MRPSGEKFKNDYSGRGQLSHIYDQTLVGSPFQVLYYHDDSGNRTARDINGKTTWDDPNFTTYHYDANNRNLSTQHYWATANIMWSHLYNYGYDKMGNRQYEMRDWQSQGDGFQYDLANQITGYQREGTVNTSTGQVTLPANDDTLNLDASGNRKSVIDNGRTISYGTANNLNQYSIVAGLAATYDANGNLATYNGWTYTYNAMNQLTHASASGTDAYFWYDGLGRICTWQSTGGPGVRFNVWSGWDLVEEYAYPDNGLLATYLHGENLDEMVSMTSDGATKYLYQDGRGNTSAVAAANGMVLETYKYDLNGTPTVYDPAGNVISAGSTVDNRFLFGGREWYPTLGLYNFRNRFYLPNIGRFLQPDPIGFAGDPANLYRYCANNPVNWSDPYGLKDPEAPEIVVTGSGIPVPQQRLDSGGSPLSTYRYDGRGSGSGPFGGFVANVGGGEFIDRVNSNLDRQRQRNQAQNANGPGQPAAVAPVSMSVTAFIDGRIEPGTKTIQGAILNPNGQLNVLPGFVGLTNIPLGFASVPVQGYLLSSTNVSGSYPSFTVNMQAFAQAVPLVLVAGPLLAIHYNLNINTNFATHSATLTGSLSSYPSYSVQVGGQVIYQRAQTDFLFGLLPGNEVSPGP